MSAAQVLTVGGKKLVLGSRAIIDDILLWCKCAKLLSTYFEYACKVFLKYHVSLQLYTCKFIKPRVEYVGYNILTNGNCPDASKFIMIND